jgi:hypothetical protein
MPDINLEGDQIEVSSNGQNCFILSQNVPKFELYEHNDELFNIYYEILNFELLQMKYPLSDVRLGVVYC